MKKQDLVALLKSVTMDELRKAIPIKEKMETLQQKKQALEKDLASVVTQIKSLVVQAGGEAPARAGKKGARKGRRRRVAQPSLSSLVVQILKERQRPLKINDICDALLQEKKYETRAKDFKAQLRVMMYRNDKGLFRKAAPGLFGLAAGTEPKATAKAATKTKTKAKKTTRTKVRKKVRAKARAKKKTKK
jgi:HB1, ASXL, restriction endonuclease HTH domain